MKLIIEGEIKEMEYRSNMGNKHEELVKGKYKDYEFLIVSVNIYPVAYITIPETHPLYFDKEGLCSRIDCSGGVTYIGEILSTSRMVIGWDYAHSSDYVFNESEFWGDGYPCTKHTTQGILEEVKNVLKQLEKWRNDE